MYANVVLTCRPRLPAYGFSLRTAAAVHSHTLSVASDSSAAILRSLDFGGRPPVHNLLTFGVFHDRIDDSIRCLFRMRFDCSDDATDHGCC